jgi:CobQ-like glutamine amidotransferase family enzyme
MKEIRICHLYPDLLNLYGDRGNIACMRKRLEWRGIKPLVTEIVTGDTPDFSDYDIVLLGGGSDREQAIVCNNLLKDKKDIRGYVEEGGVLIAVCGGYQLLGEYYQTNSEKIEGLGLVPLHTIQGEGRLIGNIVLENPKFKDKIVGFENHGGRTYVEEGIKPFGKVLYGFGNNDENNSDHNQSAENERYEGVIYKNIIGTYLHGPLLPKNPEICDYLLGRALEKKYGIGNLTPLPDENEKKANAYIVDRFTTR